MSPPDWIALAGVLATVVGTLAGTVLGATLAGRQERAARQAVEERQQRLEVAAALAEADLALDEFNPQTLAVATAQDRSQGIDRSVARLARLERGEHLARAQSLLAVVHVRNPATGVRAGAGTLATELGWLQFHVTAWYRAAVVTQGWWSRLTGRDPLGRAAREESQEQAAAALEATRAARDRLADAAYDPPPHTPEADAQTR